MTQNRKVSFDYDYYNGSFERLILKYINIGENLRKKKRPQNIFNSVEYVNKREIGFQSVRETNDFKQFGTQHLIQNGMLKEFEIQLGRLNKIFCSEWLSDRQIVFGTKCNKLMVLDVTTKKMVQIPSLKSSSESKPPDDPGGIHALKINPSRTMMATGSLNANDVAVYKLPTLDPLCVGEGAHKDWIFDITWLDDEFLVSGSRDTSIALWRIKEKENESNSSICDIYPSYDIMSSLCIKICQNAEKVRALLYNKQEQVLVALSLNGFLHLWDAQLFRQNCSRNLPHHQENVCIAQHYDHKLYAVGSRSHITLLDTKNLESVHRITSKYQGCGVRSLSFIGDLLTIGTGIGVLMFYDVRRRRYLEQANSGRSALLQATRGWVYPDEMFHEVFSSLEYNPAIYTHCYDSSGTRLFAGGGPLPSSLQGNYASLWQ